MIALQVLMWLGVFVCIWFCWPVWYGLIKPRRLQDVNPALQEGDWPCVSVIMPARDEEAAVETALRSLLALDYPNLEVIAIDDRSRDATGAIMDRVAANDPRCRVIHVTQLPAGWLGKNHANSLGAATARGDYILFTDGDVIFNPATLRLAVAHMQKHHIDHLTVVPDSMMTTVREQLMMNYFTVQFGIFTRMAITHFHWARQAFVGIGAFNMVRREAYERFGGHESLKMEVADDAMLGKLVKKAGMRQDVLLGQHLVRVKWQQGMGGIVRGLDKNAFAAARYSVGLILLAVMIHLAGAWAPLVLLFFHATRIPAALLVVMVAGTQIAMAWRNEFKLLAALLYPIAALMFIYVLLRSTWLTLRAGGVRWRDTFYPLAELRAGMVEWRPFGGLLRGRR